MNIFAKLVAVGVDESMDQVLKRNVRVINIIYILECSIVLLYHPILLFSKEYYSFTFNNLFLINGLCGLYFNHLGLYKKACANYLIFFPILIVVFCWFFGEPLHAEYYLFFVIPIIWILLEEQFIMISLTVYIAILFLVSQISYEFIDPRIEVPEWFRYFGYMNIVTTFVSLALVVSVFRNYSDQYIDKISKKNYLLNKFMSIISHDVRSPLVAIKGTLALIENKELSEDQINDLFRKLNSAQDRVLNLLDNLLYWSRQQMDRAYIKRENIDLTEITKECVELYQDSADRKKLNVINYLNEPLVCFADKEMIRLVVRNIINNAIKFTSENDKIMINAVTDETTVRFFVSDTGQGLSLTELYDVRDKTNFRNLGTKGESGVGLGLILCRDFLERNEGNLYIKSEPGVGSTFSFTLQRYSHETGVREAKKKSKNQSISGFVKA